MCPNVCQDYPPPQERIATLEGEVAIKCKLQTQLNYLQEVSYRGYMVMEYVAIGTQ